MTLANQRYLGKNINQIGVDKMSIKTDKDNNNVLVVDTLSDLLELLSQQGIQVKISDTSELRDLDIEESFEDED